MDLPDKKYQVITELLNEQLEQGNTFVLTVVSNSMSPLIRAADKVMVEKFVPEKLHTGDIILYKYRQTFCMHRYILKRKSNKAVEYITKGDRFFRFDRPFSEDKIIGKIKAIKRNDVQLDLSNYSCQIKTRIFSFFYKIRWYSYQLLKRILFLSLLAKKCDRFFMLD